jgi:hypothetical protein
MSDLAQAGIMLEVSANGLLKTIQNSINIFGVAPVPNFRLTVMDGKVRKFDGVFDSASIELLPSTANMNLHLHYAGAVFQPASGPSVPLQDGELVVHMEAKVGTPLNAKMDSAEVKAKQALDPSVQSEANSVLSGALDTNTEWNLFPDTQSDAVTLFGFLLALGGSVFCLDADTLVVLGPGGVASAKTRSMDPFHEISIGLSADLVRKFVLCPALVTTIPDDSLKRWALKNQKGYSDQHIGDILANPQNFPDDTNFANQFVQGVQNDPASNVALLSDLIPPDSKDDQKSCGSGKLPLATGTLYSAYMDTVDFTFQNGFIQMDGTFEANAECFTIDDGTIQEKITLSVSGQQITGKFQPNPPQPNFTVNMSWWCQVISVLGFWLGSLIIEPVLNSIISSVIQGVMGQKKLSDAGGGVPSPGKAVWDNVKVSPEGVVLFGRIDITLAANPDTSRIWFESSAAPDGVQDLGKGIYNYPGSPACKPAQFTYEHLQENETITLLAESTMLIDPVAYQWSLAGKPISGSGKVDYVTDVQTAVPPPNGVLLTGHQVEISYSEGWPIWKYNLDEDTRMVLSTRGSDCNYLVLVELRAQDASGRQFYDGGYVQVVGDIAQFGSDYDQYMTQCEMATLVMLSKVRTRPQTFVNNGKPLNVEQVVQIVKEAYAAGDPSASTLLKVFTMTRGAAAMRSVFGEGAAPIISGAVARTSSVG